MFVNKHSLPRWKKEWIPLATQQLRLRNLIQILAFSIKNDKIKTVNSKTNEVSDSKHLLEDSYYFTLHATFMSAPFYTSEKIKSENPNWKELDMTSWEGNISNSIDAVVIRLWFSNPNESEDKILSVWGVYLSGLIYLGPKLKPDVLLKPNSLVFLMPGGYFTDPKCLDESTKIRYTSVMTNSSEVRLSYSITTLTRLQTLQQVIKKVVAEAKILKKKIAMGEFYINESRGRTSLRKLLSKHKPKTNHLDLVKVKENIEMASYRVKTLEKEVGVILERIGELTKKIKSLSDANFMLESKTMESYRVLRREVCSHKEWKKSYIDKREKYLHSKAMLSFRTKQLISELNLIYPIQRISQDKFTICGVHLPNSEDFAGHDDLHISVALGFVTHVIQMISVFLQIPLRYPVVHFGSRSRIIDQIADQIPDSEREFCLYIKGKEKLQFDYAVYLLNKNIAQMRWVCGLPTSDLRNTLENLSSLVNMKLENSVLNQTSRSLSSSAADICSSTVSVPSPIGSVLSFQSKHCPRLHYTSDSGPDLHSSFPSRGHRVSRSEGSSKYFKDLNLLSLKSKNLFNKKNCNNLSCSLDKGLNEYEEIVSVRGKDSDQFNSEPTLNSSVKVAKIIQAETKDKYLKTWNTESQKVPFSDDDSESQLDILNKTKQTGSPIGGCTEFKESNACLIDEQLPCDIAVEALNSDLDKETSAKNLQLPDSENKTFFCDETTCIPSDDQEVKKCDNVNKEEIVNNINKTDIENKVLITDTLLENVTSRTEALANRTTSFNRFRTRFKSTLEG